MQHSSYRIGVIKGNLDRPLFFIRIAAIGLVAPPPSLSLARSLAPSRRQHAYSSPSSAHLLSQQVLDADRAADSVTCAGEHTTRSGDHAPPPGTRRASMGARCSRSRPVLGSWGKTVRDAVRNKERWSRRRAPTQYPRTDLARRRARIQLSREERRRQRPRLPSALLQSLRPCHVPVRLVAVLGC